MQRHLPADRYLSAFPHLQFLLRAFCIECASRPKLALSLPIRGLSFWLADRPFFTSFRMTGPAGRQARNADFIIIAAKGGYPQPSGRRPVKPKNLKNPRGEAPSTFPAESFEPSEPGPPSGPFTAEPSCDTMKPTDGDGVRRAISCFRRMLLRDDDSCSFSEQEIFLWRL